MAQGFTKGNITLPLPVTQGGTGVTTSTGSGNTVLSTSPTFTTPVLGTPTSGALANCTSIPVAQATGLLPIANGGTNLAASNPVVQRVNTETGAVATGTTTIPFDDTIPQNTEGTQFMSLAITPKNTANILVIDVVTNTCSSAANVFGINALFQDSTANALAAVYGTPYFGVNFGTTTTFQHTMTAGTTSATTFKVRIGGHSAATITFNGQTGGRIFGGVMASSITITEYST